MFVAGLQKNHWRRKTLLCVLSSLRSNVGMAKMMNECCLMPCKSAASSGDDQWAAIQNKH